jgi:hypothetical protein
MIRMNLLYKANEAETGLSVKFGKACMGLMIAWGLNYSYVRTTPRTWGCCGLQGRHRRWSGEWGDADA